MNCTNCGNVVKPVVALDIDGTLGDYHGHLYNFARNYFNHAGIAEARTFSGEMPYREWFMWKFQCDLRTFRDVKLAYRQGAQKRSMPVYGGASLLSHDLHDAGAEVWLTTTRPYLRLDNIDPDTRAWLERHRIYYDMLMYDENKYEVLAERVDPRRVVAVLDDEIIQVRQATRVYGAGRVLLRSGSYNSEVSPPEGVLRVHTLPAAGMHIITKIKNWKSVNR